MIDKDSILQIIGCLMKHPQYLTETDKYNLTPADFQTRLDKYIFVAIENLYSQGANKINPIDVENFLLTNDAAKACFKEKNGIEYLQDAESLSDNETFDYYYGRLKKFNLLNDFNKMGIDTSEFYVENSIDPKALKINANFENLSITEVIDKIRKKVLLIEKEYNQNDVTETESAFTDIQEILNDAESMNDIGCPIQGEYFNEVLAGARKGTLCIRSGGSGVSKTRQAVGDACYLAFPFRYDEKTCKWVQEGGNQKVLFIATEQNFKEIRKMILAYLTGFNESKFRYGQFTDNEQLILKQAIWVMEQYEENFYIVRMPNPTIELVKSIVRENCVMRDIDCVFYDYIFIGPSLLNEFKGFNLRNDEVLLMFATALKDLAVEQNVFVMTSTQVNASADDNTKIRNESSLAGGRSTINKADVGAVMARPTKEELETLSPATQELGIEPNIVTDIYKVRSGEWNQVRIWSDVNLGNLRKKDLFITNSRLEILEDFNRTYNYVTNWEDNSFLEQLKTLNEMK